MPHRNVTFLHQSKKLNKRGNGSPKLYWVLTKTRPYFIRMTTEIITSSSWHQTALG
jgi:hypothetical protein